MFRIAFVVALSAARDYLFHSYKNTLLFASAARWGRIKLAPSTSRAHARMLPEIATRAVGRSALPRKIRSAELRRPLSVSMSLIGSEDEIGLTGHPGMSVYGSRESYIDSVSRLEGSSDVSQLLSDWQEEQAINDDGSGSAPSSAEQKAMISSWRKLIDSKEQELRKAKRRDMREALDSTWAPAHFTGWWTPDSDDNDDKLDLPDGIESTAIDALLEAEAEDADEVDEGFVAAWQAAAEEERESRAGKTARPGLAARLTDKLSWFGGKRSPSGADEAAEPAIGIDLGTTNCAVAAIDKTGQPFIIADTAGSRVSPSVVSYVTKDDKPTASVRPLLDADGGTRVLVGTQAQRQFVTNAQSTYASTKRLMGRTATAEELRALAALDVPYKTFGNGSEGRQVLLACPALRRAISPDDAAAELVRGMVCQAEAALGKRVHRAVVTVPAYFDDSQRLATETACLLAGLEEVKLLREPEAAALSYALDQQQDQRIMVFDLGGGTFDVSILDVGNGVVEVIASAGDPRLGGDDWDRVVARWLEDEFVREHAVPVDAFGRRRLLDAAEEAKVLLSTQQTTQVEVASLQGDKGLNVTLSRRKFEALCRHLVLRLVEPMREAARMADIPLDESNWGTLKRADLAPKGAKRWRKKVAWRWRRMARRAGSQKGFPLGNVPISKVLLVGGATRMPCIGRFIKRVTGLTATPDARVNPDESVALGAAVMAGVLDGSVRQTVLRNPYQHSRAAGRLGDNILPDVELYKD